MQALVFDTRIYSNGVIKIPELSNWKGNEVSIIVIKKPGGKIALTNKPKREIDIVTQKTLSEFDRIRNMKTGDTEIATMDNTINIYDELTGISG